MDEAQPLLTKAQVEARLNVSKRTVDRLIASGDLKAIRLGSRATRIYPESVEAYLARSAA